MNAQSKMNDKKNHLYRAELQHTRKNSNQTRSSSVQLADANDDDKYVKDMTNIIDTEKKILLDKIANDIKILKLCNAISKCVRNFVDKKSFWNFGSYTKTISKDSYPKNYDCTMCPLYKRLLEDFESKGIKVIGTPLKSSNEKINGITIYYYAKNKLVFFKKNLW